MFRLGQYTTFILLKGSEMAKKKASVVFTTYTHFTEQNVCFGYIPAAVNT